MSKFNHPTFGDVQSHVFLEGTILKVYLDGDPGGSWVWDTADVEYENKKIFLNAAIRYHCIPICVERANGAVADGGRGFDVGDKVILMAKIGSTRALGEEYEKVYVVGHRDGKIPCTYRYLFIRISAGALIPSAPPYGIWTAPGQNPVYTVTTPDSHLHEYCMVWDTMKGTVATVLNPVTKINYVFPVTVEDFKPALDYFTLSDEELFTLESQGDEQSQEAGFTPDYRSDFKGDLIRDGAAPSAWWTSYDINANPVFSLLSNTSLSLFTDNAGASDGTFAKTMEKFNHSNDAEANAAWMTNFTCGNEDISKWKAASPLALNDERREFDVQGSGTTQDITPTGQARLQVLQTLIGQMTDLINALDTTKVNRWIALSAKVPLGDPAEQAELVALSTDQSIVQYQIYKGRRDTAQAEVDSILGKGFTPWEYAHDKNGKALKGRSYHMQTAFGEDEVWACAKDLYSGIVIDSCDAKWKFVRLSTIPPYIPVAPPSYTEPLTLAEISLLMATTLTNIDDGNIFSYGTLKRINDGGFHRTSHPALKTSGVGSWRMTQGKIPYNPLEPVFFTAMNTRSENIDVWDRYDNWMNSFQYSCATYGVDRTWWFKSNAEQWRIKASYIDTPIGSMWYAAPEWEAAVWYLDGVAFSPGDITARRDKVINTQFIRQTKHNRSVIAQIYIVQRQAVTMYEDPALSFVKQELNKGVYDCLVPESVKYVGGLDYDTMTSEQKKAAISNRVYLRTIYPGEVGYSPPAALRSNRNEVEIMAACDLYSTLKTTYGDCSPTRQIRNGLLEYEIQKLITKYYTSEALDLKDFSAFNLEARIV